MNARVIATFFSLLLTSQSVLCMTEPAAPIEDPKTAAVSGETKEVASIRHDYATVVFTGDAIKDRAILAALTPPSGNYKTHAEDWHAYWALHDKSKCFYYIWDIKKSDFCCEINEKRRKRKARLMIKFTFLKNPDENYDVDEVVNRLYPTVTLTKEETHDDDMQYSCYVKNHCIGRETNNCACLSSKFVNIVSRREMMSCEHCRKIIHAADQWSDEPTVEIGEAFVLASLARTEAVKKYQVERLAQQFTLTSIGCTCGGCLG